MIKSFLQKCEEIREDPTTGCTVAYHQLCEEIDKLQSWSDQVTENIENSGTLDIIEELLKERQKG